MVVRRPPGPCTRCGRTRSWINATYSCRTNGVAAAHLHARAKSRALSLAAHAVYKLTATRSRRERWWAVMRQPRNCRPPLPKTWRTEPYRSLQCQDTGTASIGLSHSSKTGRLRTRPKAVEGYIFISPHLYTQVQVAVTVAPWPHHSPSVTQGRIMRGISRHTAPWVPCGGQGATARQSLRCRRAPQAVRM